MKKKLISALLLLLIATLSVCSGCQLKQNLDEDNYEYYYKEILDQYHGLLTNGLIEDEDYEGKEGISEIRRYMTSEEALETVGYLIKDITGDNIPELIIGTIDDTIEHEDDKKYGKDIYNVYTLKDTKPYQVINGWYRNMYRYMGDNKFYNSGSNGAIYSIFGTYELSKDGQTLRVEDFYFTYEKDENFENIGYYYNTTGEWDVTKSQELNISPEEFYGISETMESQVKEIELVPFKNYIKSEEIKIFYAKEDDNNKHEEVIIDDSEYSVEVVFESQKKLKNFKLLKLTYKDIDNTGNVIYDIEEAYTKENFLPSDSIKAKMAFVGTIPNNGFSYEDEKGKVKQFTISESGKDGSLVINEF